MVLSSERWKCDCSKARSVFDDVYTCCVDLSVLFVAINLTILVFRIETVETYHLSDHIFENSILTKLLFRSIIFQWHTKYI